MRKPLSSTEKLENRPLLATHRRDPLNTTTPTVDIITPYYNALHFIEAFVQMLLSQTYTHWKAYLIDDASTDGCREHLIELTRYDSRFFHLTNSCSPELHGPGSARNTGISASSSNLIAFCDIDDLWHPEKLRKQIHFHQSNHLDVSVTAYARFGSQSPNYITSIRIPPATLRYRRLLLGNCLPFSSALVTRNIFLDRAFRSIKHEDYEFWLSIFRNYPELRYGSLDQVLMFYRVHSASLSANKALMPGWVFRVYRSIGYNLYSSLALIVLWLSCQFFDLSRELLLGFRPGRSRQTLLSLLALNQPSM